MRFNLAGFGFIDVDGYGRFTGKTAQAMIRNGHEVYPFEIRTLDQPSWFLRAQNLTFDRITIQIMPPHDMRHLPGRSVAYTMHESGKLPRGWADHVNQKSELLLVPAETLVEVFSEAGVKVPIEVVKSGIDPDECSLTRPRHSGPYTFGCLGDRGNRKGWDKVWTAFYKVFDFNNKDVRLLIKARPGSMKGLDFSYSPDERLTVWREDVRSIADVFSQMDAFMFPTRYEGWGMPPREAAACGLPVVVTRYAGTDDETDEWAIPLENYKLIESGMKDCGGLWAEPSLDELCEHMLWLYEHQDDARQKGLAAAKWLRANRTYSQAADNLVATIGRYTGNIPLTRDEATVTRWVKPVENYPDGRKEPVLEQG